MDLHVSMIAGRHMIHLLTEMVLTFCYRKWY
jgi:hypothetical protein